MLRVTFGDNTVHHFADSSALDVPSRGDLITVLWDTTDEVHVFGRAVREWMPCIVMSVPEPSEEREVGNASTIYKMLYLPNMLRALYGPHSTMQVHQDLSKLPWRWCNASDEFEYDAHRELARFS
jgi:hypothetical protein